MRFRAVVFDLFGTLVPSFPASRFERSLMEMAAAVGINAQAFVGKWRDETWRARALGEFATIEANVEHIAAALGIRPGPAQVRQAERIRKRFTRDFLQPRGDALATLQALKAAGMRLAVITDCSAEVPELWPDTPFAGLVDVPIFSCLVGLKKPDPSIYGLACERLGVAPDDCLYIGDGFSRELSGAARVRMRAVLLKVPGEISADTSENEGGRWAGLRVATLREVLTIALRDR